VVIKAGFIGGARWTDIYIRYGGLIFGTALFLLGLSHPMLSALGNSQGWIKAGSPGVRMLSGMEPWFSIIFTLLGSLLLIRYAYKVLRRWSIRRNGERVTADILRVETDASVSINGISPMRIVAGATAGGARREFRSQALAFDPAEYLKAQDIKSLALYLDPQNPKAYDLDISILTRRDLVYLPAVLLFWNAAAVLVLAAILFWM
jgi:hypothetical protein